MTAFDKFFNEPSDVPSDPRLREWKQRIDAGESACLEVYRPPSTLGLCSSKMYLTFVDDEKRQSVEEADWDERLNIGLIRLQVRCMGPENEAERFALGLRDGLKPVEKEFGNGYFNAVLLDVIVDSELDREYPEIADVLRFTFHALTERRSRTYERCRDAIALGISARAKELRGPLEYTQDEAAAILARAIARYLDERFSVTSRRQLGLLS